MQRKPNSQSKVPTDLMRQFLVSSPGRPPAAGTTVSVAAALRLMAPTTGPWGGRRVGRAGMLIVRLVPAGIFLLRALAPGIGRLPSAQPGRQFRKPGPGVADDGECPMLVGIEAGGVERDQPVVLVG